MIDWAIEANFDSDAEATPDRVKSPADWTCYAITWASNAECSGSSSLWLSCVLASSVPMCSSVSTWILSQPRLGEAASKEGTESGVLRKAAAEMSKYRAQVHSFTGRCTVLSPESLIGADPELGVDTSRAEEAFVWIGRIVNHFSKTERSGNVRGPYGRVSQTMAT